MSRRRYTVLGWVVWQVCSRIVRRKWARHRAKLGAATVIAAVVGAGFLAARGERAPR